jgi:hypothetical protein
MPGVVVSLILIFVLSKRFSLKLLTCQSGVLVLDGAFEKAAKLINY